MKSPNYHQYKKTNKAIMIMGKLLKKKMQEIETQRYQEEFDNLGESIDKILIDIIDLERRKGNKTLTDENVINKVTMLIKKISGFNRFLKFNSIEDSVLKLAVPYINLIYLPPNRLVFKQSDLTKDFFCIIKGKISIRSRKNTYETSMRNMIKAKEVKEIQALKLSFHTSSTKLVEDSTIQMLGQGLVKLKSKQSKEIVMNSASKYSQSSINANIQSKSLENNSVLCSQSIKEDFLNGKTLIGLKTNKTSPMTNIFSNSAEKKFLSVHEEEEKLQMTDGMCSRDWGLIYKIPRIASAFTLEQTLLFTFDKDTFIKYFNKSILKAEAERKRFICKIIPSIITIPPNKLNDFFCSIMPIYHKNKEVIYSANEPAVAFYIIYDGNCHLINSQAGVTDNNIDQMSRHTRKIVLTLEKGDIIGLESLSMEKNKVYEFTLISNNDSTTLLKIDLSKLNPENAAQITNELLNIHETKRKIIHDMLETRNKIQNKMQEYVKNARETKKLLTKTYDTNNKSIEEELIKIRFKKLEEKFKFRNLPIRKYRIDQESFKYEKIKSNTRNSEENIDLSKNKMPKMHSRHTSLITTTKSKPFTPLMSPIRNSNLVHSFSRDAKSKVMQTSHISSEVMLSSNLRKTVGEWKLTMEGKRNYQYTTKRFKLPLYIMKSSENC